MPNRPTFSRQKARSIEKAVERMQNHREHVLEEEKLPPYRRDHIPKGCLERVELGTHHDVTVMLSIRDGQFEMRVDVVSLADTRREKQLADVSLFFESLVDIVRRKTRSLDGVDADAISPELLFQGKDVDAYYRADQTLTGD